MFTEISVTHKYKGIAFTPEDEEKICKIATGDVLAKLNMVKTCMNLVVKLANWYSLENCADFTQMIQVGIMAIIRAAETFNSSKQTNFIDYASQTIVKEMMKSSKVYSSNIVHPN